MWYNSIIDVYSTYNINIGTYIFSLSGSVYKMSNGHVVRSLNVLKMYKYKMCGICKYRLKWPFVNTIQCLSILLYWYYIIFYIHLKYLIGIQRLLWSLLLYYKFLHMLYLIFIIYVLIDCSLTCHEECLKSLACPLGPKPTDRPINIFESKV